MAYTIKKSRRACYINKFNEKCENIKVKESF